MHWNQTPDVLPYDFLFQHLLLLFMLRHMFRNFNAFRFVYFGLRDVSHARKKGN